MPDIEEIAEQVIKSFTSISKGANMYPPSHPAVTTPLNSVSDSIRKLHAESPTIKFGIVNGMLFFADYVFYDETSAVAQLIKTLTEKEVAEISIETDFKNEELFETLKIFSMPTSKTKEFDVRAMMIEKGVSKITVKYDDEEETIEERAKKTYYEALDVVTSSFNDVRMGRIPKAEATKKAAKDIVEIVFADHNAMLCLTMIKAYDDYTFNHSVNVSILAIAIAKSLGYDEGMINEIGSAGLLHDIGKTLTEKQIILKPGRLTEEEYGVIKKHPEKGYDILSQMDGINKNTMDIVLQHHVHYDRKGYPKIDPTIELNQYTTLITTADTYDAITTFRPYQRAVTPKEAIDIMLRFDGKYFEKHILTKFVETLGLFPTGSFARLDSNEIALVTKQNPDDISTPIVKIVIDSSGNKLDEAIEADLSETDGSGNRKRSIVSAVDPTFMGLSVEDYV